MHRSTSSRRGGVDRSATMTSDHGGMERSLLDPQAFKRTLRVGNSSTWTSLDETRRPGVWGKSPLDERDVTQSHRDASLSDIPSETLSPGLPGDRSFFPSDLLITTYPCITEILRRRNRLVTSSREDVRLEVPIQREVPDVFLCFVFSYSDRSRRCPLARIRSSNPRSSSTSSGWSSTRFWRWARSSRRL